MAPQSRRAAAVAAALAVLPAVAHARVLPPPWPYDGFAHFPTLWFGANASGLDNETTLALVARHALAGYGWQQGTNATGFRHCEAQGAAAATRLADYLAAHPPPPGGPPPPPVFVYRHFQMAWTFFDVTRAVALDPAYDGMMLHDRDGAGATCAQPVGNTTPPTSPLFAWLNASAGDFWVDNVVAELASEAAAGLGVAAAFFDETDWSYCGYNFARDGCTLSDGYLEAEYAAKYAVLRRTAAALNAAGVWPLFSSKNLFNASFDGLGSGAKRPCLVPWDAYVAALDGAGYLRFEEFWVSSGSADTDAAQVDTAIRAAGLGMGFVARAQAAEPCPGGSVGDTATLARGATRATAAGASVPLSYALAAFLVVQAPHTYFGYSTGWYDADWCWRREYDGAYGAPLGPAMRTGPHTWTRNFTGCDVALDTAARTGVIVMK
jgi:hypothetical protein